MAPVTAVLNAAQISAANIFTAGKDEIQIPSSFSKRKAFLFLLAVFVLMPHAKSELFETYTGWNRSIELNAKMLTTYVGNFHIVVVLRCWIKIDMHFRIDWGEIASL